MHRLFVALRPPTWVRERLLALMEGVPGARWQDDEQLHLTLRFIGEVDRPTAEDAATALARITQPAPCLSVEGVGTFANRGRVHTLWAGIAADDRLRLLQARIERAVTLAGLPPERRVFFPHITLARLNHSSGSVGNFVARNAGLALSDIQLDAFYLYESELGRTGATYTMVARFPLT